MRGRRRWHPFTQLLDDAVLGGAARTSGAPHVRAPTGAQGLHLQFVIGSLPVALLVVWDSLLPHAMLLGAALLTAGFWEVLFAWQRRRPVDEGILLTAWLFALLVPVETPLLQAVISISFGVVFGKAVFGGDGRYLVSPPLLALAFLALAYPDTAVDPFGPVPAPGNELIVALCCLFGAAWLIATGSASWRLIAGAVAGLLLAVGVASLTGLAPAAMATNAPWYWPLVSGGFAFGVVFVATDPTASAMTNPGRFASGILTGLLSYLVGVMFAILLASLVAPLFDAAAVALNSRRRRAREGRP